MKNITFNRTTRRKRRVSPNIRGTEERPRVVVFRSNKYIYAQVIDDLNRKTLVSFSSVQNNKGEKKESVKKTDDAKQIGLELAKLMKEKKITKAVFDRSAYSYNGRVKALAEGLREGGLEI